MTNTKKQVKITKLFRKGTTHVPNDCDELQEEIQQLEQRLKEKQDELFQMQRNSYRHKTSPVKQKGDVFVRPQKIVLTNAVESLKNNLELMSMLTGTEVKSFVVDEHCYIMFHMQHDSQHAVKHSLLIDLHSGGNVVSKSSLPLGFNMSAVMEDFDNIMVPECLGSIRNALVAYYNRLEQFEALKKMLNVEVQLFKILDGSHIEISFTAQSEYEAEDNEIGLVLVLDYRVYDVRPKQYYFKDTDITEDAAAALKEQCAVLKRKPLHKAFKEAFISGVGPYKLVQQFGVEREERQPARKHKRFRPNKHQYNDDTFLPEDCSVNSEDAEDD